MFAAEARGRPGWPRRVPLRVPAVWRWATIPRALSGFAPAAARAISTSGWPAPWPHCTALARPLRPGSDNSFGRLPQSTHAAPTWPSSYRFRRLEPQLLLARDAGLCSSPWRAIRPGCSPVLEERVGPAEPGAACTAIRGGNVIGDETGVACLIDPACTAATARSTWPYAPVRRLRTHVFAAYEEAWPLSLATKTACRSINSLPHGSRQSLRRVVCRASRGCLARSRVGLLVADWLN